MSKNPRPSDTQKYAASQHKLRQRYRKQQAALRDAHLRGDTPGLERDLRRINNALYYLMMPVFFLAIAALMLVLGSVPVLFLLFCR